MQVDSEHPAETREAAMTGALLAHYDRHARTLPWRAPPGRPAPDPYRVWLSEIMLQQTTVAAVIAYYEAFTRRWPTLADLAAADEGELMAAWAGLGYYSRARNLIACARTLVADHGGVFPPSSGELRKLPGVGAYTSAAIAAIAFGEQVAVVDANVERVVARLYAIDTPLPAAKTEIHARTQALTPAYRPGDFAQAMMDLGATICTPRRPQCLICPLSKHCAARAEGRQEELPVKPAKKAKPKRTGTAFWIERGDHVLLVRRPAKGMLGGMVALPDDGWRAGASGDEVPPIAGKWRRVETVVRHGFTHFDLSLSVSWLSLDDADVPLPPGDWHPIARIEEAGLPTLFAKAARALLAARAASA